MSKHTRENQKLIRQYQRTYRNLEDREGESHMEKAFLKETKLCRARAVSPRHREGTKKINPMTLFSPTPYF